MHTFTKEFRVVIKIKIEALFHLFKKNSVPVKFLPVLILTIAYHTVVGSSGNPDPAFGTNGLIITAGKSNGAISKQADGKLLVGGTFTDNQGNKEFSITRYNLNGSVDNSFGNGEVHTYFSGTQNIITSIFVYPNGKILAAGYQSFSATAASNGDLIIARYNLNGTLDNSFNTTGMLTVTGFNSQVFRIGVQSSGRIIVNGNTEMRGFNADGTAASDFGASGQVLYPFFIYTSSIGLQSDDKIVSIGVNLSLNSIILRYNADGTVDSTFGTNGQTITSYSSSGYDNSNSITFQNDGKIIVAGATQPNAPSNTNYLFVLARYNVDGTLDAGFGGDGVVTSALGTSNGISNSYTMFTVNVAADGKIVAAGGSHDFQIGRFNADGSVDNSFGSGGATSLNLDKNNISTGAVISGNDVYIVGTSPDYGAVFAGISLGSTETLGLNYKYYQGSFTTLPNFSSLTPVKCGTTPNVDISIRNAGVNDNFAFLWEGYIILPTAGTYTFETVSDDGSKLYFNTTYSAGASALVNNDGLHAPVSATGSVTVAAGTYPIAVSFFEATGGENMQVYWTGPGIARQVIPNSAFTTSSPPPSTSSGINYKYYEGSFTTLPDFNNLAPVKTGTSAIPDISVRNAGVNDNFAFLWEGYIVLPTAGQYTFETVSDDGSKLYFNTAYSAGASALVNNDGIHASTSATGRTSTMAAGTYPIAISFFEATGGENMQVYWTGPGISRQLIPASAFTVTPPSLPNGINYKYYEGSFTTLPDFSQLTPVQTGVSPNTDISARPTGVNDNFAFLWEGYINLPTTGQYTFETVSDDGSKLYFNTTYSAGTTPLVNNDGIHAATTASGTTATMPAGIYPIAISFFEATGGESMQVYWTGPGIPRQLVPTSAYVVSGTPPPPATGGLNYKYYEGSFTALPNFNLLSPIKSGTTTNTDISIRNTGVNDNFAFVWEGYINLPTAGNYTFETISDDGSKLYFNSLYNPGNTALVNNDGIHAPTSATGSVNVAAGVYPIAITFFEATGGETMQVYWTGPGISRQLIPDSAFTLASFANTTAIMSHGTDVLQQTADQAGNPVKHVYPNPFSESFTIDFYNSLSTNDISISIYDLNGKQVFMNRAGKLPAGNNMIRMNLNSINIKNGVYIVQIQKNGIPWKTTKVVKMKR